MDPLSLQTAYPYGSSSCLDLQTFYSLDPLFLQTLYPYAPSILPDLLSLGLSISPDPLSISLDPLSLWILYPHGPSIPADPLSPYAPEIQTHPTAGGK